MFQGLVLTLIPKTKSHFLKGKFCVEYLENCKFEMSGVDTPNGRYTVHIINLKTMPQLYTMKYQKSS